MFSLATPAQPYTDPWLQALPARLAMLAGGRRRVAYYYEAPNNSSFRYRAYNMAQVLNADAEHDTSASYFFRPDLSRVDEIADLADVLVICRSAYDHTVAQLIARLHARGKPVLFDIDDFVFDTDYAHLLIDTLALDKDDPRVWDDWFAMMARMGQTLRRCDGAITTNEFLAQRMRAFSGKPVAVVPNFMNAEQLAMSAAVFDEKQRRGFAGDGPPCVGYFSGSPSHKLDFEIVESALAALLAEHRELRLMMVGYIEPGTALAPFANRIDRQPFHDYVNLQRLIGSVEFNLMPLQSNVFTDCKSELKYFEAAAAGTLSIASPSHTYAACIRDCENGYLARAHQWQHVLEHALARMADYPAMAGAARDDALWRYSGPVQRPAIARALGWG
ncbi:MAG: glycosyltransferase family 1 protein [Burkholderiales bacterium]|nr:glycosyltransferase family 1 protein [Burkholderiales bacterium]